jgi:hypothetical protein
VSQRAPKATAPSEPEFEVWLAAEPTTLFEARSDRPIAEFVYLELLKKNEGRSYQDPRWFAPEGALIAERCKALFGDTPFRWTQRDSAAFVASRIPGSRVVEVTP